MWRYVENPMLTKIRFCIILIFLTYPNLAMVTNTANDRLFWGINEGDSLDYKLRSTTVSEQIGIQLIVKNLPEIHNAIQILIDIPIVEIEMHAGNSTYTTLNELVWIPSSILAWKPLFMVLPVPSLAERQN